MRRRKGKPRRIVGAFDTETSNVEALPGVTRAFFSLYQVARIRDGLTVTDLVPSNVRDAVGVNLHRHAEDAWRDLLAMGEAADGYVPVVAVHNLGFDMHALSPLLLSWNAESGVKVTAKTPQKPITITLLDERGRDWLTFWDTLGFSGKGLETMGLECGFEKAVGEWDYDRVRTPETPLTDGERRYAENDVYALLTWLGWFFRREHLLDPSEAGKSLVTKTGVVRRKRSILFDHVTGTGAKRTVGDYWRILNETQRFRDDDELKTFHACTRGGFTFAARGHAGRAIECGDGEAVYAYDATSQHPAHMCMHWYPVRFAEADPRVIDVDADTVASIGPDAVLRRFARPFPVAFDAAFDFTNIRMKPGTVFMRDGISPLAYARVCPREVEDERDYIVEELRLQGYSDRAPDGCDRAFGKVFSAPYIRLFLTELDYWIVSQAFEWDDCRCVYGYETARFQRPSDYSVLSVMEFYHRKNEIKAVRAAYSPGKPCPEARKLDGILPDYFVAALCRGDVYEEDLEAYYMQAKADLNALYGIEVTNEARRDIVLSEDGLVYTGAYGVDNIDKPKACYQYGQRIVGWSRVAQALVIMGAGSRGRAVVNGDTDSVKIWAAEGQRRRIDAWLAKYADACDRARERTTARIRARYPDLYRDLSGVGHYICEGAYKRFYSAWNKAYVHDDYRITLAGVPSVNRTRDGDRGLEAFARALEAEGRTFAETAGCALGYNATIDPGVTNLRGRAIPAFGSRWAGTVEDWRGESAYVEEPCAVGLFPLAKTIGGFANPENAVNARISQANGGPAVDVEPRILAWDGERPAICRLEG